MMKKTLFLVLTVLAGIYSASAGPVDVETAKQAGKQFATSFNNNRQQPDLQLVYTGTSDDGAACFYAFNVDKEGFVVISADDRFRPVVGYSDEGVFETENPSPELMFYLDKIIEARTSPNAVLPGDAQEEWKALLSGNRPISRNGGKEALYLCQTKWNQNAPYNLYAPAADAGPGGRCYAGCVATAMSQLMKYWDHPAQGTGSHGYYSGYGYLSVNFGATQYHFENMPNRVTANTTDEQKEAIALLMYHCGVSVNMNYSPNGSGAFSDDVPDAIRSYFSYTNQTQHGYRNEYTLTRWKNKLKQQIDYGWPIYYCGYSNTGGHAFVCDGYDDNDLFHYNWGWGGSSDGWFVVDEIDYANWASAIFNFVPDHVYQYMPASPSDLAVESLGDSDFSAVLSWTNPTETIHGGNLSSIDQVVITRNGKVIQIIENVAPGQAMSYTDHYLPTVVTYSVYAIASAAKGAPAMVKDVALGPSCLWTVEMEGSDGQGWGGGAISVLDGFGIEIARLSPDDGQKSVQFELPLGRISFLWTGAPTLVDMMRFAFYDADGNLMTGFEGQSKNLKEGLFYQAYNACSVAESLPAPKNLRVDVRNNDVLLQWEVEDETPLSFFVYRDGALYDMSRENTYLDVDASDSFHHYYVTAFNGETESVPSLTCNIQPATTCPAPSNFRYEIVNANRVKYFWDAVETDEVVCYNIYRRTAGEEFTLFKTVYDAQYAVTLTVWPWQIFDMAVTAYYEGSENESAFAATAADPSKYYLELDRTVIPIHLDYDTMDQGVMLSWVPALLANRYAVYRNGVLLDDQVTQTTYFDADAPHEEPCCYYVVGMNDYLVSNPSFTVCVDWTSASVNEPMAVDRFTVAPNPVSHQLSVTADGLLGVVVYNHLGQQVLQKETNENTMILDVESWSTGLYFLRLTSTSGTSVVKVVKE